MFFSVLVFFRVTYFVINHSTNNNKKIALIFSNFRGHDNFKAMNHSLVPESLLWLPYWGLCKYDKGAYGYDKFNVWDIALSFRLQSDISWIMQPIL